MTSDDRLTWNLFFDILAGAGAITMFAALDIAAGDKRDRVEMCPDCSDQSCPACHGEVDQ
jgi:hypothetical protein